MSGDLLAQYAFASPSTSGNTTIIAAQTGQRIVVLHICVITGGTNNVKFQSNATTDITALFPLASNGGFVLPFSMAGWFQTNIGESLTVNMSGAFSTAIQLVWFPRST